MEKSGQRLGGSSLVVAGGSRDRRGEHGVRLKKRNRTARKAI